jgi:hypothetical protein
MFKKDNLPGSLDDFDGIIGNYTFEQRTAYFELYKELLPFVRAGVLEVSHALSLFSEDEQALLLDARLFFEKISGCHGAKKLISALMSGDAERIRNTFDGLISSAKAKPDKLFSVQKDLSELMGVMVQYAMSDSGIEKHILHQLNQVLPLHLTDEQFSSRDAVHQALEQYVSPNNETKPNMS